MVGRGVAALASFAAVGLTLAAPAVAAPGPIITPYVGIGGTSAPAIPGPATSSPLGAPVGTAVNDDGDLYIGDAGNNVVEKVTPDGTLTVVAGTGTAGSPVPGPATDSPLNNPYGLALDQQGDLYIADSVNADVEKVTPSGILSIVAGTNIAGAPTPGPASSSALGAPSGLAIDSSGNLYVADSHNDVVEQITPRGTLSILAGSVGNGGAPTPGPATDSDLDGPSDVAVDAAGDVYITDLNQGRVVKVTAGGTLSVVAGNGTQGLAVPGPATESPLTFPFGLAIDANGDLYISNLTGEQIDKVDPSGTLSVVAGTGLPGVPSYGGPAVDSALAFPAGLAVNSDGTLYVAEAFYDAVDRIGQPTPGIPRDVALQAQDGSALLSFTAPVDPGTSPVTGYQISLDGGASWQAIATSATQGTLTSTVNALTDGITYTVRVRAVNRSGPGPSSPPATATPTTPPAPGPTTTTTTTTSAPTPAAHGAASARPAATGRLTAAGIGPLALRMTRSQAQRQGHLQRRPRGFLRLRLVHGGIRVGFPIASLLNRLAVPERHQVAGRVIIALTSNPRYAVHGIRVRTRVSAARHQLALGAGITVGLNTWYVIWSRTAAWVLKAQHGIIREIGVTDPTLTTTEAAQQLLVRHL